MTGPAASEESEESPLEHLKADLGRYFEMAEARGLWAKLRTVALTEAIWAIAVYRLGRYLRTRSPRALRALLQGPYALAQLATRLAVGVYLDPSAEIGPGLYVGHSGGVWVAPRTVIGRGCNLNHEVTIGVAGKHKRGVPALGDRVWVGTKATVAGPIRVGSGAVIGANSLVTTNVPENAVVVGVPARVISYGGSAALLEPA